MEFPFNIPFNNICPFEFSMSISPTFLGAGLRHAYAFGPLTPEEGLLTISCFGDVAFCSESICIAFANSPTLNLTIPIPAPTDTLEDNPINSIYASRCLWRVGDNSPSIPQQLVWGLAETKVYRVLCPRLCVVTFVGDLFLYTLFLDRTITSCIPACYIRRLVPNIYTLHVISHTNQCIYTAVSSAESITGDVVITIFQMMVAPEAYTNGIIGELSLEIKKLVTFPSVSHIISVSYEAITESAAILCDSCIIFINLKTNSSVIVPQSDIMGTNLAKIQKISIASMQKNNDLQVYIFCADSNLRSFTITFERQDNNSATLFNRLSVELQGTWNPVDSMNNAVVTNDRIRSIIPSPIIHNLKGVSENGKESSTEFLSWTAAGYKILNGCVSIPIPSELEGHLHYISYMTAILSSLVAILTMNGAVIFLKFDQSDNDCTIYAVSTQLLFSHLSDVALSLVAGPQPADPSSIIQLLPIRRSYIIPLRIIISSTIPLSVSAFCLYKPLSGTTQQRLLRTTSHRIPLPYDLQHLVQCLFTNKSTFIQQEITPDATPQVSLGTDFSIQHLRAAGTLTPKHCKEAFQLTLLSSKYKDHLKFNSILSNSGVENSTSHTHKGITYSLCVFTGEMCDNLSLPFCKNCEIVLSDVIVDLVQEILNSIHCETEKDPLTTLFIELGTTYWLCPMCLSSLSYI